MRPTSVALIGKEANHLEHAQAGLFTTSDQILQTYPGRVDRPLRDLILPTLAPLSGRVLAELVDTDRRTIDRVRNGQEPRPSLRRALTREAVNIALYGLRLGKRPLRASDETILTAWLDRRRPI